MNKRTWIPILVVAPLVMTLSGQPAAQNLNLGTEAQQQAGKVLYDKYCAQCHGVDGDGEGYAAPHLRPRPRDFTSAKFKLRTTPSGALPTDDDLRKVIREGMPYTTMIGWPDLTAKDIDNIIYYIKTFSDDFENPNYYEQPIAIPDPPSFSTESAEKGREVYVQMGCVRCHGDQGRGDGTSAPTLVNDAGETLLPADLTKRWTFRGGPTRRDIYRTFTTGLNGTPMPSYADSLTAEQRWLLVDYVYSLGRADEPNYSEHVVSRNVEEELDLALGAELFAEAESAFFPLVGQIIEPGRAFHPITTGIEVKAVHNGEEVAFLLRWHDMRPDVSGRNAPNLEVPPVETPRDGEAPSPRAAPQDGSAEPSVTEGEDEPAGEADPTLLGETAGDDFWGETVQSDAEEPPADDSGDPAASSAGETAGDDFWGAPSAEEEAAPDPFSTEGQGKAPAASESAFSDAVAMQFPSVLPESIRLPYFLFGDVEKSVDIWFADLAQDSPQRFVGRGSGSLAAGDAEGLEMSAAYDAGEWTVMFKRERRLEDAMPILDDTWYPVAFSVWDGWSEDRGNKRALTRWFYVYIEPEDKVGPVAPMTKAALITLGIEIILIAFVRRKYKHQLGPEAESTSESLT